MGGAGCGLVSSTLLKLGAEVTATDLEGPFLGHLESNLQLNTADGLRVPRCHALDWCDSASRSGVRSLLGDAGVDAIFAADCIYDVAIVQPFLATIAALAGPHTVAFMSGVPHPPSCPTKATTDDDFYSMLDAFLDAAPLSFDCYLVTANADIGSDVQDLDVEQEVKAPGE